MVPDFKLFDNLPEAIQVIGKDLRCVYANKAAKQQIGFDGDPVAGKPVQDIYAGADMSELALSFEKCLKQGLTSDIMIETNVSDGTYFFSTSYSTH